MSLKKSPKVQEIAETDEFITISTKVISYIIENKNKVILWAGTFCAVILIVVFTNQYLESKENTASSLQYSALTAFDKIKSNENPDASESIKALESLIQEYSGTVAGKFAIINVADISFKTGDYAKAETYYTRALKEFSNHESIKVIVMSGLAYTYLKLQKADDALVQFEKILESSDKSRHAEALFNMSLIYGTKNEIEKSNEVCDRILADYKESTYYLLVKEKMGV
jgi:predicted negative regulator of RcsB-dependent stress response